MRSASEALLKLSQEPRHPGQRSATPSLRQMAAYTQRLQTTLMALRGEKPRMMLGRCTDQLTAPPRRETSAKRMSSWS
jgi:hypothetical protein